MRTEGTVSVKMSAKGACTCGLLRKARLQLGRKLIVKALSADVSSTRKFRRNVGLGSEDAIRQKTSEEVFRGWFVLKILSYDAIVDNSVKVRYGMRNSKKSSLYSYSVCVCICMVSTNHLQIMQALAEHNHISPILFCLIFKKKYTLYGRECMCVLDE